MSKYAARHRDLVMTKEAVSPRVSRVTFAIGTVLVVTLLILLFR